MTDAEVTLKLFNIASEAALQHVFTCPLTGTEYRPEVFWQGPDIIVMVPQNAQLTQKSSRKLLSSAREAIKRAFADAGLEKSWRWRSKTSSKGTLTWVHNTGFWNMGQFHVTSRYCVFLGPT